MLNAIFTVLKGTGTMLNVTFTVLKGIVAQMNAIFTEAKGIVTLLNAKETRMAECFLFTDAYILLHYDTKV